MDEPLDWERVGDAITARMDELALSQADLSRRAGISTTKIRDFQRGGTPNPRTTTLRKLEIALEWPRGAIAEIGHGRPVPAGEPGSIILEGGDVSVEAELTAENLDLMLRRRYGDPADRIRLLEELLALAEEDFEEGEEPPTEDRG